MNAFDFAAPTSVEDAVKLLDGQNTAALAGGTDLLGRIKDQVTSPQRVVYLKDIKASSGISGDAGSGLTIGAGTLLAAIIEHKAIREAYPRSGNQPPRWAPPRSATWQPWGVTCSSGLGAGTSAPATVCWQ